MQHSGSPHGELEIGREDFHHSPRGRSFVERSRPAKPAPDSRFLERPYNHRDIRKSRKDASLSDLVHASEHLQGRLAVWHFAGILDVIFQAVSFSGFFFNHTRLLPLSDVLRSLEHQSY